jgi:hypothetical protein
MSVIRSLRRVQNLQREAAAALFKRPEALIAAPHRKSAGYHATLFVFIQSRIMAKIFSSLDGDEFIGRRTWH